MSPARHATRRHGIPLHRKVFLLIDDHPKRGKLNIVRCRRRQGRRLLHKVRPPTYVRYVCTCTFTGQIGGGEIEAGEKLDACLTAILFWASDQSAYIADGVSAILP
jgi:hypothetical protein